MDNYPDGVTANDIDKHYSSDRCCDLCHWYYVGVCAVDLKNILDHEAIAYGTDRNALESILTAIDDSWHSSGDCCKKFLEE